MKIAINGFGHIGRLVFRAALHVDELEFVAINDLGDVKTLVHLLTYDSVHGKFPGVVEEKNGNIWVNNRELLVLSERDPTKLPWGELGIDVVVESTGHFRTKELAMKHIEAGAKRVLISAPAKGEGPVRTIIMGVNHGTYDPKEDKVVSVGSCTTNCLTPLVKLIHDAYGIDHGFLMTVHSYTAGQTLTDGPHKDPRRARAAAINLIPTTTGP